MEAIVEAGAGIGWRARVRHDVWQVELRRVLHDMMATPSRHLRFSDAAFDAACVAFNDDVEAQHENM